MICRFKIIIRYQDNCFSSSSSFNQSLSVFKWKNSYGIIFFLTSYTDVYFFLFLSKVIKLWIELPWPDNLSNTHGNARELFRPYWVSSAVYTMISTTGDRTSDHVLQSRNWAISPYPKQVTPNLFVRVIARPINLTVSCKLHPYSLQRAQSPTGARLPKRIKNTHLRNSYKELMLLLRLNKLNLKSQLYFLFETVIPKTISVMHCFQWLPCQPSRGLNCFLSIEFPD